MTCGEDGVGELVMDAPPVNAYTFAFVERLRDGARTLHDARAVVLRSAVDRIFAAGGDIPYMARAPLEEQLAYVDLCQEAYEAFEALPCPVVAAIDGACLGGGLELALACDIRVAGASAVLGLPEVTIGILAGGGAIHRLVRTAGQGWARDLLLTGRRVSGAEALTAGIVTRVTEDGGADAAALALARELAGGAPDAQREVKRLTLDAPDDTFATGMALEREAWARVRVTGSSQEGLEAFAEKRRPDYRGAGGGRG